MDIKVTPIKNHTVNTQFGTLHLRQGEDLFVPEQVLDLLVQQEAVDPATLPVIVHDPDVSMPSTLAQKIANDTGKLAIVNGVTARPSPPKVEEAPVPPQAVTTPPDASQTVPPTGADGATAPGSSGGDAKHVNLAEQLANTEVKS